MTPDLDTTRSEPTPGDRLSRMEAIVLGWKLLASELRWLALKSLRRWEIRQLRKRLRQEYANLGRLTSRNAPKDATDLCRSQIEFLQEEIEYLEKELTTTREDIVSRRLQQWGLEDVSPLEQDQ